MSGLRQHVAWWLDLYRWEFPLPEREALGAELDGLLAYYRETDALVGDVLDFTHPVVRGTAELLENFREAYLVSARTIAAQKEWPISEAALLKRMRRQFATSLLLGEVKKPEGNSVITFQSSLSRLAELGHLVPSRKGRGGREKWVERGAAIDRLPELVRHLRS